MSFIRSRAIGAGACKLNLRSTLRVYKTEGAVPVLRDQKQCVRSHLM